MKEPIAASFYDAEYFAGGTKSNYDLYGPGSWADDLADMIWTYYQPTSVLDVGCAYGYLVERLDRKGIPTFGFDISEYAVRRANHPNVWVGDASKVESYRHVDLIVATELPEHLTEEQSELFLTHCYTWGQRALLLIATEEEEGDLSLQKDHSHINMKPMSWWQALALRLGWSVASSEDINNDRRSKQMEWDGRFLYLVKGE